MTAAATSIPSRFRPFHQQTLQSRDYNKYQPLQVRGGGGTTLEASSSAALRSTADAVNGSREVSTRERYWRIARELGQHVWPSVPKKAPKQKVSNVADYDAVINDNHKAVTADANNSIQKERKAALAIRYRVIASIVLMLAGKGVTIATPFIFKMLVDIVPSYMVDGTASSAAAATGAASSILANSPISLPVLLLLSYGICRSLTSLFRESTTAIFAHVAQSAIRRFGRSTFDHVHSLDLQYHLNRNTGALSRVLERGSRSISYTLNAMVFNTIPTLVEVGVVTGLMFKKFGLYHALTVMLTIVIYSAYTIFITQWRSSIRKDMIFLDNKAAGKLSDSLLNYETVKYFNNEMQEGQSYETTLHKYQKMALKATSSLSALNFGQNAIFSMGLTLIMYLTLRRVKQGLATIGDLVLVNGLLFQLSVPLNFIGWVYQEVKQAFIDMEAMFELRDTIPEIVDSPNAVDFDPVRDGTTIEFDELEFGYKTSAPSMSEGGSTSSAVTSTQSTNGYKQQTHHVLHEEQIMTTTTRPILQKTTFTIPQGKTIAIVGSSGCGKSTLLRMIYRFYAPEKGSIRIGGKDISNYTTESIRKAIAVVPQDVVLFNDSIGYNIHYGNLNASWDQVIEASKKAHLHDTIMRLPNGYNTVVGERGLKMSGGEKQRVSLARAILKRAPILLCDEPTSSLDSHTELEIMNNLKEIGNDDDTTCLIIAHRLSTIQDCDEIVVMDAGRVIEQGSHDELMRRGGRYSELVAFQSSHSSSSDEEDEVVAGGDEMVREGLKVNGGRNLEVR
eukprot:CAMPEP_0201994348 /NCGR_PEP_ID=MMETSP0905-20130828/2218_1 /ASSEMBLY_ACC=CAM_ASM_000554 /TAXON_ID=420261 /ORGANISM="Thalassiosira antarctica, Strain CCMP982" /LENGTH=787 /DNA_ID=CAMNT_0048549301 /DNA_START=78 /DNA_END=2441 /DNA_ORIENTATION=-